MTVAGGGCSAVDAGSYTWWNTPGADVNQDIVCLGDSTFHALMVGRPTTSLWLVGPPWLVVWLLLPTPSSTSYLDYNQETDPRGAGGHDMGDRRHG